MRGGGFLLRIKGSYDHDPTYRILDRIVKGKQYFAAVGGWWEGWYHEDKEPLITLKRRYCQLHFSPIEDEP
jgi:hypothetical protein